jgi:hypothetical protein
VTCIDTPATEIVAGNIAHTVAVFTRAADVDDPLAGTTATMTVIELDGTEHAVTPDVTIDEDAGTVTAVGDWPIPADHAAGRIVVRTETAGALIGVREDAFMVVAQT